MNDLNKFVDDHMRNNRRYFKTKFSRTTRVETFARKLFKTLIVDFSKYFSWEIIVNFYTLNIWRERVYMI